MPELIYTKQGRPLKVSGEGLFSRSGKHVARIRNEKAYDPNGKYVGTIVGDRLVYRSSDSAYAASSFMARDGFGHTYANRLAVATWGDEPPIPD